MTPENKKKVNSIKNLLETISGKKLVVKELLHNTDMIVDDTGKLEIDEYLTDKDQSI